MNYEKNKSLINLNNKKMPCEVNEKGLNACAHEASKVL